VKGYACHGCSTCAKCSFRARILLASLMRLNSGVRSVAVVGSKVYIGDPKLTLGGTCIHALTRSITPVQESLKFTDTSCLTFREETFNSADCILSLTITLRITWARGNKLKTPLDCEFGELRRNKRRPIICDQCIWHSKSTKNGRET